VQSQYKFLVSRIISLFIVLAAATLSAQTAADSYAILDLEGRGISAYEAASLTDRLRSELVNVGSVRIVERGNMEQILSEQDFQLAGCTSNECAVEVGELLGVSVMIAGSIGRVGRAFSLDIRLIDVSTGVIIRSIMRDYLGEIEGLLQEMRQLALDVTRATGEDQQPVAEPPIQETVIAVQPAEIEERVPPQEVAPSQVERPGQRDTPDLGRLYRYALEADITFLSLGYESSGRPNPGVIMAGYFPRQFAPDMPLGLLPYNHRSPYLILDYSEDEASKTFNFWGRYVTGNGLDLRAEYSGYNVDFTSDKSSTVGVGIGGYLGRLYGLYEYGRTEETGGARSHGQHVQMSYYPSAFHAIELNARSGRGETSLMEEIPDEVSFRLKRYELAYRRLLRDRLEATLEYSTEDRDLEFDVDIGDGMPLHSVWTSHVNELQVKLTYFSSRVFSFGISCEFKEHSNETSGYFRVRKQNEQLYTVSISRYFREALLMSVALSEGLSFGKEKSIVNYVISYMF
jgi:TolB-like protein